MVDYFGSFAGGLQLGQQYGANQAMMRERQAQIEMANQQRRLAMEEQQAVSNAMQEAGGDPTKTLNILNMRGYGHIVPKLAEGFAKQAEVETKTRGEQFGLAEKKSKQIKSDIIGLKNKVNLSQSDILGVIDRNIKLKMLTPEEGETWANQFSQISDPNQLRGALDSLLRSVDVVKFAAPVLGQVDLGSQKAFTSTDPLTGQPTVTSRMGVELSPAEEEAAKRAKVAESQGWARIGLEKERLAMDKEAKRAKTPDQMGIVFEADNAIDTINKIEKHPGLPSVVGVGIPGARFIPASKEADFDAMIGTLKSQVFLNQIQKMRGLGALSNMEGMKVEQGIASLNTLQSEQQFKENLNKIKYHMQRLKDSALREGGGQQTGQSPTGLPRVGEEVDGYIYKGGDPGSESSWRKKR